MLLRELAINSTVPTGNCELCDASGYLLLNGTSMASPHVAGTVALMIASGVADIRGVLHSTADDLGKRGLDSQYGWGLVDTDEAVGAPPPPPPPPDNDSPVVNISSPVDGSTPVSGASISFAGSATDTEDDDATLTASISWSSNIDGNIGIGASFSNVLADGVHTITASVTDSGGATGSASVSITVGTPPENPVLSVTVSTDKPSYVKRDTAIITANVTDGGTPVGGAAVSIQITTAKGGQLSCSPTTNGNGDAVCTYKVNDKRDGKGTYTVNVTASKSGYDSGSGSTTFNVN